MINVKCHSDVKVSLFSFLSKFHFTVHIHSHFTGQTHSCDIPIVAMTVELRQTYSEPYQTSMMELFCKMFSGGIEKQHQAVMG